MKFFFFSLILFLNSLISFSQDYYFHSSEAGIYKISNPFFKSDSAFISINNGFYKPYFESRSNSFLIYVPNNETARLSYGVPKKLLDIFSLPKKRIIRDNIYYSYKLSNTTNNDHWLYHIINPDETYKKKIFIGKSKSKDDCEIEINLYNFFQKKLTVDIIINDSLFEFSIPSRSERIFCTQINSSSVYSDVEIYSPFGRIGINNIVVSTLDKNISYKIPFSHYLYSNHRIFSPKYVKETSKKTLNKYENNFYHFHMKNNELQKVSLFDTLTTFSNLIISRKDKIKNITLQKTIKPPIVDTKYLVIYNDLFEKEIPSLISLLKKISPDITFTSINVQYLYDEYSNSKPSSFAIKKFIHHNCEYLETILFVGDASCDEKNIKENLIPTFYHIDYENGIRYSSDYNYTYEKDPFSPIVSIGRLPFKEVRDLKLYIDKVSDYVTNNYSSITLLLDDIDLYANSSFNDSLVVYKSTSKKESLLEKTFYHYSINYINQIKPKSINYLGHGALSGWSDKNSIDISDFKALKSGILFTLFDMSCWTGAFEYNRFDTFSEELLKLPNKGAVAVISASRYTKIKYYKAINNYILQNRNEELGTLLNNMKRKLISNDMISIDDLYAYNLLGLPNLRLSN